MVKTRTVVIADQRLIELVQGRRWFGDKSRSIDSVEVAWSFRIPESPETDLCILRYHFTEGYPSLYLVALDSVTGEDVTESPSVMAWLRDSAVLELGPGKNLRWTPMVGAELPDLNGLPGRALGIEQSNTSIRYGDLALVKLNRKLSIGLSPEAELASVFAKSQDISFAPVTYGLLTLDGIFDHPVCLAVFAEYVPNQGDAWSEILADLRDGEMGRQRAVAAAISIGETTGRMHLGLLSDPWRPEVAPEPIETQQLSSWENTVHRELEVLVRQLRSVAYPSDTEAGKLIPLLYGSRESLEDQIHGFQALVRTYKIRIHGDYHLGQVLRRSDDRYVIVDFDGEPHRSLDERRQKYSALRDVAGMLRSFSYARGTVERELDAATVAELREWEADARRAFVDAYTNVVRHASVRLLPQSADDIRRAISALEIEKAIYECGYELNNRPDWLWLPLSRLVQSR